jgi:hypothetical protein
MNEINSCPTAENCERVYYHGQKEYQKALVTTLTSSIICGLQRSP